MAQKIVSHLDYVASAGDTFDSLSFHFYTEERMAHYIIQANPDFADVIVLGGGEKLLIPVLTEVESPDTLPPWRRPKNMT